MDDLIKVGYGRADITPDAPVPLGGYGNSIGRTNEVVRDPLFATCLAFTDNKDQTVLVYTTDALYAPIELINQVRDILCPELGLERHQIQVASTHSHSTPDMTLVDIPAIADCRAKYVEALCAAAREAMADRAPAIAYIGSVQTCGMNFIRHYMMTDGSYAGANFGDKTLPVAKHASTSDPWMQIIKFARLQGEDITLVNFQAHPCFTGGINAKVLSADYIGDMRRYVEEQTHTRFAFFQGAAGNHNGFSYLASETRFNDSTGYGEELGKYVVGALPGLRHVNADNIFCNKRTLTLEIDHSDDWMVPQCLKIQAEWEKNHDRDASNAQAKAIGLNSIYAVLSLISRSKLEQTCAMEIYSLRVGDLGFIFAPYEMFGVNGEFIKDFAPYPMTFVVTCANDRQSYLASELAFSHGCYEVDSRRYPKGTAELLANNFVEMLTELKNQ